MQQICSLLTKQSMPQFQEHTLSKEKGKCNHTVAREEAIWCGKCHDVTWGLSKYWSEHSEIILLSMHIIDKVDEYTKLIMLRAVITHRIAVHPSSQTTTPIQIHVVLIKCIFEMKQNQCPLCSLSPVLSWKHIHIPWASKSWTLEKNLLPWLC